MRTKNIVGIGWFVAIMGLVLVGGLPAWAGDRTWDGGGANNNWDTPANWDGDVTAPIGGDALFFGGSTKLTNTNTLSADTSFAGITFNSGAGAFVLAGSGNRITLGGNVTNSSANLQTLNLPMILGATRTFNTASSGSLTAGGILSGAGGLIKTGAQTLTLSNANIFTGPITIQAGTLKVDALNYVTAGDWFAHATGSSLGLPATVADGTIAIGSGASTGTLYRTGTSNEVTDRVIDLAGTTGGAVIDNGGSARTLKFTSDFTASGSGAKTLTLQSTSGGIEVAGKIVDSAGGAVTVLAAGTTAPILSGTNSTYTGPTIINNNGGLKVYSIRNLGVASSIGAPTDVANGTIQLGVGTATMTLYYLGSGSNTTDRVIDLSGTTGGGTLNFSGASGYLKFTSDFTASGAGAKTFAVTSTSGSWTNEFAGKIVDSVGGATSVSLNNSGQASAIILSGANTYTGTTTILGMNVGGGVIINSIKNVNGGPSSLGNPAPGNGTISIGNGGFPAALIYTGPGDTTDRAIDLKSTTGGITLDQSGSGLLKFTSDFTASGVGSKTLTLQGSTGGTGEVAGAIVNNSGVNLTSLTKAGTGTWVLSGTNSYSGPTTVSAGTLILSGNSACTGATIVSAGGTLVVGGKSTPGSGGLQLNGGTIQAGTDLSGANALTNNVTMANAGNTVSGTNNLTLAGSFTLTAADRTLTASVGTGSKLTLAGPVYLSEASGTGRTLTLGGTGTIEISGTIANFNGAGTAGNLTIANANTILSGTNAYTGTTTIGNGGRLQIYSTNNLGTGNLIFSVGTVEGNKGTLALRSDGSAIYARDAFFGSYFDQVNEFNVDRATAGGPANGTITWGTLGSNYVFNEDRAQLLVTGGNGYGLTLNPNVSFAGNNQDNKPQIVNNAPGLLTLQGNLTAPNVNNRSFEVSGTGDILVNGNIFGTGYYFYKTGPNTVTLAGTNSWVNGGGFSVNGGTLRMGGAAAVPSNGPLTVLNGTLDFNGLSITNTTLTMGGGAAGTASTLATGAGSLTLGNNVTYNGGVSNDNGATISGNLALGAATRTFTVADSTAANYDMTVSADIGGAFGITKAGLGTLRLSGSNSFTGATTINLGTLALDYTTDQNNKISPTAGLTFGSAGNAAGLSIIGNPSTPSLTVINGVTLAGSALSISLSGAASLNLGTVTRAVGAGQLTVNNTGSGNLSTTAGGVGIMTNANGIALGPFGDSDWLAHSADGTNVVGLSSIAGYTDMPAYVAGRDANITAGFAAPAGAKFNSIRFNAPGATTLTLSGVTTNSTGGILVTPNVGANLTKITGGSISQPSAQSANELVVIQNNTNGDLQIDSIVANGNPRLSLTKSGAGKLILTANNTATGYINLNAGTLQFGDGTTTGGLNVFGAGYQGFNAVAGTTIRIAGGVGGLTVTNTAAIIPVAGAVTIDIATNCTLVNGNFNAGVSWVQTGPGTLRQTGQGFIAGWVKEGTFLSDAGANYTINGGVTIGATNAGAPPALVKLVAAKDPTTGNSATINRTGTFDLNGHDQGLSTVTFTGGGVLTNSGSFAKAKSQVVNYNVIATGGETALYAVPLEGSWARNDNVAMQFTINDDPTLDIELIVAGGISNYPGYPGWAIQKLGNGTLVLAGTSGWTGTNAVSAGTLVAKSAASLPGYDGNARWPVSAGATLAVSAGGAGQWAAAEIDALRGTTPSHFAVGAYFGIDTTEGSFTYESIIGNGAGALGFRKLGTNTLTLTAANSYTGGTRIEKGTLVASNANALSTSGTITVYSNALFGVASDVTFSRAVTFNAGSGLTGNGTNAGGVTCPANFTVVPGLPVGTLTVNGALTLAANNTLRIAFQPDGTYGKLSVTGTLNISDATSRLVLTGKAPMGKTVLAEGTTLTGTFLGANVDMTGLTPKGIIKYENNQVVLAVYTPGAILKVY